MPSEAPEYAFREMTRDDLPMVARWLAEPHVAQWWGDPSNALQEIEAALDDIATEALIVEMDFRPIAYLQVYDPHLEDDHPYQDQPTGTLGLDMSIGLPELVGRGHGSAIIQQFAAELFAEGAPRIIIDPHPDNGRAIRAYGKAGFEIFDTRTSIEYGPAVMMALDAPEEMYR